MSGYDDVDLRNFGGQKKKRTAFAQSDTGKQIMTAMIDAVRRKEGAGMVERFSHHSFLTLRLCGSVCCGCVIRDEYSQESVELPGNAVPNIMVQTVWVVIPCLAHCTEDVLQQSQPANKLTA